MTKLNDRLRAFGLGLAAFSATVMASTIAIAEEPVNWQVYFQDPASPIMERIVGFNNGVLIVITLITLLVTGLLTVVLIRFRAKANPVPSKTTHNTVIEVLWTIVPVLILVGISIPSFTLLFEQYDPSRVIDDYDPDQTVNIKVTGFQWSWGYQYSEYDIPLMVAGPVRNAAGEIAGEPRLLASDLPLVVPVDTVIRLQVTANDVLHAFALPAMGVKLDAIPGRVTESWFLAQREGIFYGQCSELCGQFHYAMPIELRVVSDEQFDEWAVAAAENPRDARELLVVWERERLASQVAAK